MTMNRIGLGVAVAVLAVAIAGPARAQDALIVDRQFVSASRALGEPLGPAPDELSAPLAGGGRYAVMGGSIVDRVVGTITPVPPNVTLAAVDPLRGRVFVRDVASGVARISEIDITTGALRPLFAVPAGAAVEPGSVQYASAVDRLFVEVTPLSLYVDPYTHTVATFDASTGATLPGGFTFDARAFTRWLVTPEGDTAYVAPGTGLETIDLTSGNRRTLAQPVTGLQWDESFERLYARVGGTLFVLTRDGTPLGSAAMGNYCYGVATSAHTGRIYVRRVHYLPSVVVTDLRVFDGATFTLLGQVSMPLPANACEPIVHAAPGGPRRVSARASGHDVTISWINVGAASHTMLDVGLAPGRTDLTVAMGPGPSASFAGVPSGTYYLRLRGGNEFGGGRPSPEVTLVVP